MSSSTPTVSIVVPMYNLSQYVLDTIGSVLAQTYTDFEMILIDDCSKDDTVELARSVGDPRIVILRNEENSGAGKTRNNGIEAARGRYIAFLDGDDLWEPEKLERQMAFMQQTGAAFVYTRYDIIDENGTSYATSGSIPKTATYHQLLRHCFIRTSSIIYDTEKLGGKVYMPLIKKRQDFALFLRLLKKCGKAHLLDESLCSYRLHPGGISSKKSKNIPFQWAIYREEEKLSLPYSLFLMGNWFLRSGSVVVYRKLMERSAFRGREAASS